MSPRTPPPPRDGWSKKRVPPVLALGIGALLLSACGAADRPASPPIREAAPPVAPEKPERLAAELSAARTADEEVLLFRRLRRSGMQVQSFDAQGRRLDTSQPRWWDHAHRVEVTIGETRIGHVLLDGKNVLSLMRE